MPDTVRALVVTDSHLYDDIRREKNDLNPYSTLRSVVETATRQDEPDVVITTGDVANKPILDTYRVFDSLLREFTDCPIIGTPGNHDIKLSFSTVISEIPLEFCHWRIIPLDTHIDNTLEGKVDDENLAACAADLAETEKHVLMMLHHPTIEIGTKWIDPHRVSNGIEVMDTFAASNRVRAVLFGHIHQVFEGQYNTMRVFATPSTCWQFAVGGDSFSFDDKSPGWRWMYLHQDGSIDSEVFRLDEAL